MLQVEAVLSGVDGIFTLREGQRTALFASLSGKDVFALLLTGFGTATLSSVSNRTGIRKPQDVTS